MAWPSDLRRSVETYTDGTVLICMVDAKTHRLVWQGQADDARGPYARVFAGGLRSCAVADDPELTCWGDANAVSDPPEVIMDRT